MQFEFTSDLMTGEASIDRQHHEILEMGNTLFSSVQSAAIFRSLVFLNNYVVEHFAHEEYAMETHGFPHLQRHCAWHQRFCDQLYTVTSNVKRLGPSMIFKPRVQILIEDWFLQHIRIMDRELAAFLRQLPNRAPLPLPKVQPQMKSPNVALKYRDVRINVTSP
jgi:hemerythrin